MVKATRKKTRTRRREALPDRAKTIAKVFWSGRSQAVRLPKEFRVPGHEMTIERDGDRIVLKPLVIAVDKNGWPIGFWGIFGMLDEDFDLGVRTQRHERSSPLGE